MCHKDSQHMSLDGIQFRCLFICIRFCRLWFWSVLVGVVSCIDIRRIREEWRGHNCGLKRLVRVVTMQVNSHTASPLKPLFSDGKEIFSHLEIYKKFLQSHPSLFRHNLGTTRVKIAPTWISVLKKFVPLLWANHKRLQILKAELKGFWESPFRTI